jgi:hypothetical protein
MHIISLQSKYRLSQNFEITTKLLIINFKVHNYVSETIFKRIFFYNLLY